MDWNPQQKKAARAISNAFSKKKDEEKDEPSMWDSVKSQIEERKKKLQAGWEKKSK